jgi:hypothetical protein
MLPSKARSSSANDHNKAGDELKGIAAKDDITLHTSSR